MSRRQRPSKPPPDGDSHGFDVDAVLQVKPTYGVLLRRGFRKRCARCGGSHLYQGWFRMVERCPTCGYLFEREPGFFVGAYLINFAIAEGFLFVMLMGFILWKAGHPDAGLVPALVIGFAIGVIGPILFYPYARTIWSAIDLAMTPLELAEIVAAADAVEASSGVIDSAQGPDVHRSGDSGDSGEDPGGGPV